MSLDACYLLSYDDPGYSEPKPSRLDIKYLQENYGGECILLDNDNLIFWEKPKYTLDQEDFDILEADQIFEKIICDIWRIKKCPSLRIKITKKEIIEVQREGDHWLVYERDLGDGSMSYRRAPLEQDAVDDFGNLIEELK